MKKTTAKLMTLLIALMLALSAPLYADQGNGGNLSTDQTTSSDEQSSFGQGDHGWGHRGRHGGLNLTEDQRKQLKDILHKQREDMKITFDQIRTTRDQLNQEISLATPDMNKVNALTTQLKTLLAQTVDNRINSTLEVKKILNPEQFDKYLEFQKKMFAHRRFHKGGWGEGREGHGHKQCRWGHGCFHHHHKHHDGYQRDGGYGGHRGHGDDGQYNND